MNNYKLLEKYRKKLSVYFALFILLSLWAAQGIFLVIVFTSSNIDVKNRFETKLTGVVNILENKQEYANRIAENDTTLEKVVEKSLENVTISQNGNLVLGSAEDIDLLSDKKELIQGDYNYFKITKEVAGEKYDIIIRITNNNSLTKLSVDLLKFMGISFVFLIFFYLVGYFFVGRNFRPIKESIASLESFSANINHEMKTPLAEVISTLDLAKQTKTNYEEAINQSLKSSHKLDKILDSMLGIINLINSSYNREKLDLVSEIKEIIAENNKEILNKNIKIITRFKTKNYYKKINKQYFRICVNNIFTNAIKYSNKNSEIIITFDEGVLTVEDFGIGISEKNLKNIFSRFFREDYNNQIGLGIGLSLVKKIIDLHNWKIDIQSQKGEGTKVKISFI